MRVLLVEDQPQTAELLAKGLREQAYAVDVARTGPAALEMADLNDYDLIVLDVLLPGQTGLEVCRTLRAGSRHMPILMLTALDAVSDRVEGLDAGADDYLIKPFAFDELLARVRALLRRRPLLQRRVLRAGDLQIDTLTRTITRGGGAITLTAKEYALLEYLASRAGEVVTRAEIGEHVWDDGYDPFSNLIEVYVQRLRRKIGDAPGGELIQTRRGQGYVLAPEPSS
jgi:two-component system copper resistance phosphate regulon response regulator CusR